MLRLPRDADWAGRGVVYDVVTPAPHFRSDQWLFAVDVITRRSPVWRIGGPSLRRRSMNGYGRSAQRTWQELAPMAYAEIEDPESYFAELGEQAADQVGDLTLQMQGPDLPNETYFQKVGRINAAKMQAEEIVRAELLTPDRELWEEAAESENEDSELMTQFLALSATWQEYLNGAPMQDSDETRND